MNQEEADRWYFSAERVASLLNVPLERVHHWIEDQSIPGSRMRTGGSVFGPWRIGRADLLAFARPLVPREVLDSIEYPDGADGIVDDFERHAREQPLFHYTSASVALEAILLNGSLRLNSPVAMNDPFESDPLTPVLSMKVPVDRQPDIDDRVRELTGDVARLVRAQCRLLCLTRSGPWWENPEAFGDGFARARMWAQYADAHKGVCLAFDQARLRESFAKQFRSGRDLRAFEGPVRYRERLETSELLNITWERATEPGADLKAYVDYLFPSVVADRYLSKAWDWQTETEYRFLLQGEVGEFEYLDITPSLTGVVLGSACPYLRIRDLKARWRRIWEAGRVFQVTWDGSLPSVRPISDHSLGNGPTWKTPDPPRPVPPPR